MSTGVGSDRIGGRARKLNPARPLGRPGSDDSATRRSRAWTAGPPMMMRDSKWYGAYYAAAPADPAGGSDRTRTPGSRSGPARAGPASS
eukprot:21868-Hanusia_phi.AAC.1